MTPLVCAGSLDGGPFVHQRRKSAARKTGSMLKDLLITAGIAYGVVLLAQNGILPVPNLKKEG